MLFASYKNTPERTFSKKIPLYTPLPKTNCPTCTLTVSKLPISFLRVAIKKEMWQIHAKSLDL